MALYIVFKSRNLGALINNHYKKILHSLINFTGTLNNTDFLVLENVHYIDR